MSIALESSSNRIEGPAYIRGISSCMSIYETPELGRKMEGMMPEERRSLAGNRASKEEEESASCSSSIGRNSNSGRSSRSDDDGEDAGEVQSSYKGPLDTMDSLEESLSIRRSISKFYCGKSKSFTSLAEVSSSSMTDLAKPENAYNRKRKNLLACSNFLDRNRNYPLRNAVGGISKKPANSSRSTLALAVAMSSSESNTSDEHEPRLPPLHPPGKSPISMSPVSSSSPPQLSLSSRSFSLTDLQGATASSSIGLREKQKKFR